MNLYIRTLILAGIALALAGCSGAPVRSTSTAKPVPSHGYYLDDGPGDHPPADLAAIPDAVPKAEPLKAGANRPYTALGKEYVPILSARDYKKRGLASWYGRRYDGKPTSSGEIYDMYAMTAASPVLPIPSYARVTNLKNGHSVIVRINDRGPFHDGRIIDLSYTAAWKLDVLKGVTPVEVDGIDPSAPDSPTIVATGGDAPDPAASSGIETTALAPIGPASDPAPAAQTAAAAPAEATYLQLGAFSSALGADQVAEQIQERVGTGLPAIHKVQAGSVIKVQMGPFASLAEADQAAQRVEKETGIHAYKVVR